MLLLIEYCKTVQGDVVPKHSDLGECSDVPHFSLSKTRKAKQANRNKIKIIKKTNFLERLKERKSGEMSKKSDRDDTCDKNCTCNFDFMVHMLKN